MTCFPKLGRMFDRIAREHVVFLFQFWVRGVDYTTLPESCCPQPEERCVCAAFSLQTAKPLWPTACLGAR